MTKTIKKLAGALAFGKYRFQRFGRTYHLRIESPEDLEKILTLDEALWVATNAPIATINADPVFLANLDVDQDGRIRVAELRNGVQWLLDHLQERGEIENDQTTLRLDSLNKEAPDAGSIIASARKISRRSGNDDARSISLKEVRRIISLEEKGGLDDAGIVLTEAAADEDIQQFLNDIVTTMAGKAHRSGASGVDRDSLNEFLAEINEYLKWQEKGVLDSPTDVNDLMPLGEETHAAFRTFRRLREKIDQFFLLCQLLAVQPSAGELLGSPEHLQHDSVYDADAVRKFLSDSPIAPPNEEGVLFLTEQVNPYFAHHIKRFRQRLIEPILGNKVDKLDEQQWEKIKQTLLLHQIWIDERPETSVSVLEPARLRRYQQEKKFSESVEKLIADSHKTAFDLDNIRLLEKLILYKANMMALANSFVSFPDLYYDSTRALFEMGTLIMDGRHFTLCVKVPDMDLHAKFSASSNMFVLYVEISAKEGSKLYEAAVPVTSGDRGNLQINKWGVFRDIDGLERQARVIKIVENPISLAEAISAPFRRLARAMTAKLEEITYKAEERLGQKGSEAVASVADLSKDAPVVEKKKEADAVSGGALAGGGIALAAIGSSLAFITKTLASLSWQQIVGGLFAALLAVLLPALVVAYLKLSRRDLSAILEGAGWGINARMRLTAGQSKTFTYIPPYPDGSEGVRHRRRGFWIFLIVAIVTVLIAGGWWSFLR